MKKLKDLDEGHPFYSDEAIKKHKQRIKELEKEEKEWRRKKPAEQVIKVEDLIKEEE